MKYDTEISLRVPGSNETPRYFSIRLKENLIKEISVYPHPGRIFAISDIEGDFSSFCKLLIHSGVVDKRLKWTFDTGHLVIIGDCFNRGGQVMECLWLIYMLEERAKKEGGKIHFILGNHEIMNLDGDWRHVHPNYASKAGSRRSHAALYHGNTELWQWLRTKNAIEKIGDVLFVHAGISPELLKLQISVEEINERIRPHYIQGNNKFVDPLLNIVFNTPDSPFWYRGYYSDSANEELVDQALSHFDVKTIVTGHTVVPCVTSFFNGKLINIDTGHSSGITEGLLIKRDRFYRITGDRQRKRIK